MERNVKRVTDSFNARRRAEALEKQKRARKQATDRARKLALGADEGEDSQGDAQQPLDDETLQDSGAGPAAPPEVDMQQGGGGRRAGGGGRSPGGARLRAHYAVQLMQPEWLTDVPPDLGSEWYALPRPEGQRCLVVAARGATAARSRSGALVERFGSALPGGGPGQRAADDCFSILDCVYHEPDCTYYVLDLMCWKGYSLYDCTAEFRLYWVQSKLAESGATSPFAIGGRAAAQQAQQQAQQAQQTRRFLPLPAYRATPGGLQAAHSQPVSFCRDGLLLLHREGRYSPGQTPLALLWKDAGCSRYLLDTDAAGVPLAQQQAVLEFRMDRTVATQDDEPVVLGRMPEGFVQQLGDRLRPGKLLRFTLGPGGVALRDGRPVGADLHFEGPANQRRGRADTISKILFQQAARTQPITLGHLVAAAAASAAAAAAAEGGGGPAAPLLPTGDAMGSGDSGSLLDGARAAMSVASEAQGASSMALEAGETDGIEVDS